MMCDKISNLDGSREIDEIIFSEHSVSMSACVPS
jgi:hypothetical protein